MLDVGCCDRAVLVAILVRIELADGREIVKAADDERVHAGKHFAAKLFVRSPSILIDCNKNRMVR